MEPKRPNALGEAETLFEHRWDREVLGRCVIAWTSRLLVRRSKAHVLTGVDTVEPPFPVLLLRVMKRDGLGVDLLTLAQGEIMLFVGDVTGAIVTDPLIDADFVRCLHAPKDEESCRNKLEKG